MCEHCPNGVWFVDLTPLTDPALVMPTIGRVVGSCEALGLDRRDSLVAFLQERASLLLLDNFEHLLAAVPDIESVLAACPSITILTTSREPLHLRREHVVEVHPLPVPSTRRPAWTVEDLETVPAVTLFVARAQAAEAGFRLTTSNAACVAELSCRLDGLPLAVELAAVRTRLMGPAALVARVEQGLELLRWDTPDLPPRHRTLRATLDWSYDLLCPEEQLVFRWLGVFAGGFTLEAVAAVAVTDKLGAEPLDVLAALADKHLVGVITSAEQEPRFGLLATMRELRWSGWRRAAKQSRRGIVTSSTIWRWLSKRMAPCAVQTKQPG